MMETVMKNTALRLAIAAAIGLGFAGARSTYADAGCNSCKTREGCWVPLQPFGREPANEFKAPCREIDDEGKVKLGVCNVPIPRPGTDSFAYCVLELINCKAAYLEYTSNTGPDPDVMSCTAVLGSSKSFSIWVGEPVPVTYSIDGNAPHGSDPFVHNTSLSGTDASGYNTKDMDEFPIVLSYFFPDDQDSGDGYTHTFDLVRIVTRSAPADGSNGKLAKLTWQVYYTTSDGRNYADPSKAILTKITDGGFEYSFTGATPNHGPTQILLKEGGNEYAKVTNSYCEGSSDPLGPENSLKEQCVYNHFGPDGIYGNTDDDWVLQSRTIFVNYRSDSTQPPPPTELLGLPMLELDDEAVQRAEANEVSLDSPSQMRDYATRTYQYGANGTLSSVQSNCGSCGN